MLLTIHDSGLRKVAFIDNSKQGTLNFFNDTWTRYLDTGSSIFDFTVFKKAITSDIGQKKAYNYLNEKAFVSFRYKGKDYLHTIRKVEENEQVIKCYGINLNLELINEYANPYKSPKAMTFEEYCNAMGLLNFSFLKIGINEVSTNKISAEWEGTDTKLNRLLSLANKFGAEIEFDTKLNADSSIKSFIINVYHENDDTHQGVGRVSPTILSYGKNLKTITRTVDKTNIYNTVRPTGRDDKGNTVTIASLGSWSVNNSKGEREFYQAGEQLYAPLSMQMFPSTFTHSTGGLDQWIRKDMTVESSNPEVIRTAAYRELKKNCYPAVTYEAEGFADLDIGDTVHVYDDGFSPTLLLKMRVSEQTISFTNPQNNKTTFSNAKALENRLSQGIQQQLDRLIEETRPYTIKFATDNGTAFKNGQGQSIVTPTLLKGNKVVDCGWRWTVNSEIKSTSPSYTVKASDINQKMVLNVSAWIDNKEVASEQLTLINTFDGTNGAPGPKGDKGDKGTLDEVQLKEIKTSIDSKADGQLTQDQLNKLSDRDALIKSEMEALATKAIVEQWISEIEKLSDAESKGRKEAEDAIRKASERIIDLQRKVGELQVMTEFVDTYMSQSEEGLIVGRKDGSSKVLVSNDRISFISGGKEVASISQGVLQIDNGVFVKSLRIGRFVTFQDPTNLDRNLTMYVGGV